ncbi:TPA: HEPN domain-containing protein [Candidatus Poribacteria bacterium]|nr:HEPN domain-containing protein [Candidatus Poribacteria bacterium]
MFRAAFAALKKFVSPNILPEPSSHKGLIGKFINELINRRKVFPRKVGNYLHENLKYRIIGDYKLHDVSKRNARRCLNYAQEFLTKIEEVVKQ